MPLTSEQRRRLADALLDAFPTRSSLDVLLAFHLEARLNEIVGEKSGLREAVFAVVREFEGQERISELIAAARVENPRNMLLAALVPPSHPVEVRATGGGDGRALLLARLESATGRRTALLAAAESATNVQNEILELRRQLRDGGLLGRGDALHRGRYLLLECIGRGGFGAVWRARDQGEQRDVAIKILHAALANDEVRRERFRRGARIMAELEHRAIVKVLEPEGIDQGFHYFVMEYVCGGDLSDAVKAGRLDLAARMRVILDVANALSLAHHRALIHRDVKPANILVDAAGQARLTDFDLVAVPDTTGGTKTGALGTFIYAAPEMMDRPQDADARADVYSLGMTTLFCLYGKDLTMDVLREGVRLIEGRPGVSEHTTRVLARAIDWKREHRFSSVADFANALRWSQAHIDVAGAEGHTSQADVEAAGAEDHSLDQYPRRFGKYHLLGPLAQGETGGLYLAVNGDRGLERLMVIKTLVPQPADPEYVARFRNEAKVVVKLSHRNLSPVFDVGQVGGELFIAMDFVEGRDLRAVWNRCAKKQVAFPVDIAVYIVVSAARGTSWRERSWGRIVSGDGGHDQQMAEASSAVACQRRDGGGVQRT